MAELIMTVEQMQDRDAWLKMRNSGLGGSDAAAIMGKSPWKSRLALWAEKTGEMPPADLSGNWRVYWGTKLEDVVADWFCEVTGKRVRRRGMMRSCEHPWMLASLDREIIGEKAGLEIKTADVSQKKFWQEGEVPDAYYLQVQWYMAVTGFDRWYMAVLIGGNDARWCVVERNQAQIDELIRAGADFWQMVQDKVAPEPDGSDSSKEALDAQYPGGKAEVLELVEDEAVQAMAAYQMLKKQEDELKVQVDTVKQRIMEMMGNTEEVRISGVKVTWKTTAGRTSFDAQKFKKDHKDLYDKYVKTGKPGRTFRIWE